MLKKKEAHTFKEGDLVAMISRTHGNDGIPQQGTVVRIMPRFVEVKDSKEFLSKYLPDGRDSYPKSKDPYRTYDKRIEPWTEDHLKKRVQTIRRMKVARYDYSGLSDDQIEGIYKLLKNFESQGIPLKERILKSFEG